MLGLSQLTEDVAKGREPQKRGRELLTLGGGSDAVRSFVCINNDITLL